MISNKYTTGQGLVTSAISGGRVIHTYRHPVRAIGTYVYELSYGENFHTLSAIIFGSDDNYWALADMNKPMDVFDMPVGAKVLLPNAIVKNTDITKRFF